MFKKNKNTQSVQLNKFDTLVGTNTMIEGILKDEGTIRIDGEIKGEVMVKGDVFLGESGTITGNISGTNIIIAGKILGNVEALEQLHITSTGNLTGDICVNSFIVDENASFEGKCRMTNRIEKNNTINENLV